MAGPAATQLVGHRRTAHGASLPLAPDGPVPADARARIRLSPIEPPWDQRLARVAVKPLSATPVTPNQITTLSLAIGLLGALLYVQDGWAVHLAAVCFVLAFWLDHADGELARITGRTSAFGHYYDLAAGCAVLLALFLAIGIAARHGPLGQWSIALGVVAGVATAVIFVLRLRLERNAGKTAVRQANMLGFETEDVMYLIGPITWLGLLQPFLVLAGIGAPLFALLVLWQGRRVLIERHG